MAGRRMCFAVAAMALVAWGGGAASAQELTAVQLLANDAIGSPGGAIPVTAVTVSPDGRHVYVAGGNFSYSVSGVSTPATGIVATLSRDDGDGALTLVDAIRLGEDGVTGLVACGTLVVSPDGRHVYVTTGNDTPFSRHVRGFARDGATGMLTRVGD